MTHDVLLPQGLGLFLQIQLLADLFHLLSLLPLLLVLLGELQDKKINIFMLGSWLRGDMSAMSDEVFSQSVER